MVKIAPRQIENFLARPEFGNTGAKCRAVLLYGPDQGLVRERAERLSLGVVENLSDPFRVSLLECETLIQDPARMADESAALVMTGGRRLVRIKRASDRLSGIFKNFFGASAGGAPPGDSLIVVEADDLGPASSLRKLFESAGSAASIGCYGANADERARWVTVTLHAAGLKADRAALEYLSDRLNTDRSLARQELDKLITFAGRTPSGVTLQDCLAAVGDNADLGIEDAVYASASGNAGALDRILVTCFSEAIAPIAILRAAQRHFSRLHLAAAAAELGAAPAEIVAQQRIHFRRADSFRAQIGRWSRTAVELALQRLIRAELDCKRTAAPDQAICRAALLGLALSAAARP
jgi:DNA polymerase-3 subunit delta